MGVWFFNIVMLGVFTSLYFVYGSTQAAMSQPSPTALAGIMKKCHEAAVAEMKSSTTLGMLVSVTRSCTSTNLPNPMGTGIVVSSIVVSFHPGVTVGIATAGVRAVVTYLDSGSNINGMSFNDVRAQVGDMFQGDPSVGPVQQGGTFKYIENLVGIQARVPNTIPTGAIAMVTTVQ